VNLEEFYLPQASSHFMRLVFNLEQFYYVRREQRQMLTKSFGRGHPGDLNCFAFLVK
jgi:hypothetical protein